MIWIIPARFLFSIHRDVTPVNDKLHREFTTGDQKKKEGKFT